MRLSTLFFAIFILSFQAKAVDLDEIFSEDSTVPAPVQEVVKSWFKESCGNLNWVMSIKEIPEENKLCSREPMMYEVHTVMELSHLKSLFVFWVKEDKAKQWLVDGVYEEYPSWQICHYPEEEIREELKACY